MTRSGFTFIEIMVAILILSVGVLAAAALQVSALQGTSRAESMQSVTKVAESELSFRRYTTSYEKADDACKVDLPYGYTCSVDMTPCSIANGVFACSSGNTDKDAWQIDVTVQGQGGDAITLSSIAATGSLAAQGSGGGGDTGGEAPACWPPGQCGGGAGNGGGNGKGKP